MLLHWSTLQPQGSNDNPLAAIRFAVPVRIHSIRVFPAGAQPFASAPHIIAETDPESFYIDVFLNAHPIPQADAKERPRVPNALVRTLIAYAGGQVDFAVDMGPEAQHATRLMILKGIFNKLSIAIYGDIVSDAPPPTEVHEMRPLPSIEPVSLSKSIDPSTFSDPTALAKQLLAIIPNAPPLPLVVRLMFCLKPPNDDWDLPDFPYLHADLEVHSDGELDIEAINDLLSRPVRDESTEEELLTFAASVAESIASSKDSIDTYQIARLFSISASQHPGLSTALLHHLDIESIFTAQTLDDDETLLCLLEAASNVDIARRMNTAPFLLSLRQIQESHKADASTQATAQRLSARIAGWQCFEDALMNQRGNFEQSWDMLQELGKVESSMAIWLESVIHHEDMVAKLAEIPVQASLLSYCPLYFRDSIKISSQDAFIALVRAYIGVASVLAVWAWTDSVGNDACREHASAVIHLWQGVDGYREIVNHLLLLRQLTRRLNWISSDNEVPRQSGILAEKIICELAKDPCAVLNEELIETILSLKPKLTFITEFELLSMRKVALVSEDGLPAAVEELMFSSDHPLSLRRLRTLRVSLMLVKRELDLPKGEWKTLESFWEEGSPGIVACLIDVLVGVSGDLNGHFAIYPPPPMNQPLAEQLFLTADDLLKLIVQLTPVYTPTSRTMRNLVVACADIFACVHAAETAYSQANRAARAAKGARQACFDLVQTLSAVGIVAEPGRAGAEVVFRALLQHAGQCGDRDPALHMQQVFALVEHILPEPNVMLYDEGEPSQWVTSVLPNVLDELRLFLHRLDPEKKAHIVNQLNGLDDGVLGIGAWLLTEELKDMTRIIENLAEHLRREDYRLVLQHQVTLCLQFVFCLAKPSSTSSKWWLNAIGGTPDLSLALSDALIALLDGQYTSKYLDELVLVLATSADLFEPELRFTILLAALRGSQCTPSLFSSVSKILASLSTNVISPEPFRMEIGPALSTLTTHEVDSDTARSVLSVLQWLTSQPDSKWIALSGISSTSFTTLFTTLRPLFPADDHPALTSLQSTLILDENEYLPPPSTALPDTLNLSIHDIDDLMRKDIPTPSTPHNGAKTPDILGVIISPPTAILRSSQVATTGLTKTYTNNDFRQLRQTPSARQNTSRLPSMHGLPSESNACSARATDARAGLGNVPWCTPDA
ncbi:hypothetical protein H0H87_009357 [Tephrocybe sp. NHM501043]|nr:hypothetical protein H0H87_009357 [Tephrocybe sp. NHM501043]